MIFEEYIFVAFLCIFFCINGFFIGQKELETYKLKQSQTKNLEKLTVEECIIITKMMEKKLEEGNTVENCSIYLNIYEKLKRCENL